jgi:hypothetical protein
LDRRSFILTLVGGIAAASLGGLAVAEAAQVKPVAVPDAEALKPETAKALDETDAGFSQYWRRRRYHRHRRYYRRGW